MPFINVAKDGDITGKFKEAAKIVPKSDNESIQLYEDFLKEAGTGKVNITKYYLHTPVPTPSASPSPSPCPTPSPAPTMTPHPDFTPFPTLPPYEPPDLPDIKVDYKKIAKMYRGLGKLAEKGGFRMYIYEAVENPEVAKLIGTCLDLLSEDPQMEMKQFESSSLKFLVDFSF